MNENMPSLQRKLGLAHVFCIASGAMISSGIFVLPGMAYARTGPSVIVSYFLAGLLSIPGMLSIAEMATAMPKAGADCYGVIRSMGPSVGTIAGLLSWFSLSMKSAFALVGMAVFIAGASTFGMHFYAILFCLLFVVINVAGVKEAATLQVLLVVGLFGLMFLYIVGGLSTVQPTRFEPFAPTGLAGVFSTAGYVFVSYAGLLKIASVAEEIRRPDRNIPLGMILSLLIVSVFYTLIVFVTVGVLEPEHLKTTLTPISDGAFVFLGPWGRLSLTVAAFLAFLTTANAGIMTAARSIVPLSRDGLFPETFAGVHRKFHTPMNALLATGALIIVSLFLRLEVLVEAASVVLILTNVLACLSVVVLRESRVQNYQPLFHTPLYPWLQIVGLIGFGFVILEMGLEAYLISALLALAGFACYWFYGRKRVTRESALLHLIARITAKELVTGTLETELKEIIRERDDLVLDRFDRIIEKCPVLDIEGQLDLETFFKTAAGELAERTHVAESILLDCLHERESETSTALTPELAIPHIVIDGKKTFEILLARSREGIRFCDNAQAVRAVFVLAGTKDERNFHLRTLSAIAQIVGDRGFMEKWTSARGPEALRDLILLGARSRI